MRVNCPECETENEIEFVDPNSESQSVECVACNVQFVAAKDGSYETQAISQDMPEGEALTADVGQVSDLGQEPETFEEEPESIDSSFDPDNIENMLDQMLEDDAPEAFTDIVEDAGASPPEIDEDSIDTNTSGLESEIEDAPEIVTDQTEITDTISASPGGDDLENILDGVLEDTNFGGVDNDVEDAPEVVTDQIEDAETISAPPGGDDLDSILDGMLTDTSFGGVDSHVEDAPEVVADPNEVVEEVFPEPSEKDLDNVLDGMLNSDGGVEDVLDSEVEDAPEIVVDPNQEEAEKAAEPPSEEDLDNVLDGMLDNDVDPTGAETPVEDAPEILEKDSPKEIESEQPVDVASEPLSEKTTETDQNSDMETISPEISEKVENIEEDTEEADEVDEVEESEEDILNSLKEEMGLDDLFGGDEDDIGEPESKPDENIDEQIAAEPENITEEPELPISVPEQTDDELSQVEAKNESSDEIAPPEGVSEESDAQDEIERMLEENIQEDEEITQETPQELKEENATVEEKLDEIWDDTVNNSEEVTEEPKEISKTNSEDHTVAEEKPEESEDDLWAQAFAEQDDLNKEQEAPKAEEAAGADEADGGEDDLWAQAFAEQDDLNKEQEAPKADEAAGADGADGSEEDLWAQAFAEQDELNKDKEAPKEEGSGSEESEEDLWAQAFAEQDELNKEKEPEDAEAVDVVDTAEEDHSQAAPEEDEAAMAVAEDVEEASPDTGGIKEEDYEDDEDEAGAEDEEEEESDAGGIREEDYEDEEDDDEGYEEEEEDEPRRKIGPIPIPSSTLGKALMGASLAAVLITAGGFYFGIQTFMPEEVAKYIPFLKKEAPAAEDAVSKEEGASEAGKEADPNQTEEASPDALSLAMEGEDNSEPPKKEMEQKEESGDEKSAETPSEADSASEKPAQDEKTEAAAPANQDPQSNSMQKEQPVPADTEKPKEKEKPLILGSEENVSEEAKDVTKALQAALGDKGEASVDPDSGLLAALSPTEKTIMFGTIMPVAYNINDIRVLSFDLQVELDNGKTAKLIREALPVYEKIMVDTVEKFLEKKFYNDILYVKEKLQKQLQKNFNKSIKGGRVKKAKFKEFTIQ
jgi:hypothetical protein